MPHLTTWIDGVMTTKVMTNPYGDAERDAMVIIAMLAAVGALLWIRIVCALAAPTMTERGRVLVVAVCACAVQSIMLGGVLPSMGVISSTQNYATNVASSEPGANCSLTYQTVPLLQFHIRPIRVSGSFIYDLYIMRPSITL